MPTMKVPSTTTKSKTKTVIDLEKLGKIFVLNHADKCYIEKVHAMPGQGVTSMFNFGYAYGVVKMGAASFCDETIDVTPQKWKKHFNLLKTEKKDATALAKSFDKRITSSGKADAYLIGRYALEALG